MSKLDHTAIINALISGSVTLLAVWLAVAAKYWYDARRSRIAAAQHDDEEEHELDLQYLRLELEFTHFCESVQRVFAKVLKMIEKLRKRDYAAAEHFADDIEVEIATLKISGPPAKPSSPRIKPAEPE